MEFLFHCLGIESDVSRYGQREKPAASVAPDSRQGKRTALQRRRSNGYRRQALSGFRLHGGFGAFASPATKLLPGWHRSPAITPTARSMIKKGPHSAVQKRESSGNLEAVQRHALELLSRLWPRMTPNRSRQDRPFAKPARSLRRHVENSYPPHSNL